MGTPKGMAKTIIQGVQFLCAIKGRGWETTVFGKTEHQKARGGAAVLHCPLHPGPKGARI